MNSAPPKAEHDEHSGNEPQLAERVASGNHKECLPDHHASRGIEPGREASDLGHISCGSPAFTRVDALALC